MSCARKYAVDTPRMRRARATTGIWVFGISAFLAVAIGGAFTGPVLAADLAAKVPAAVPLVPIIGWTGWYVGVNAGWANSTDELNTVATPTPDSVLGVPAGTSEILAALSTGTIPVGHRNGFIGGGQIGYNWQLGAFVTGLETDIQGLSGLSSTGSITTTGVGPGGITTISTETATLNTKFLGTVRGRLGFLATPTLLLYGTGGLAYGDVSASVSLLQLASNGASGAGAGAFSETRTGWTAGAGLEWMFAQNWSAKVEYLHYDLGTGSFVWQAASGNFPTGATVYQTNLSSARFDGNVVRAGVNLHF